MRHHPTRQRRLMRHRTSSQRTRRPDRRLPVCKRLATSSRKPERRQIGYKKGCEDTMSKAKEKAGALP